MSVTEGKKPIRCAWTGDWAHVDPLLVSYHDREWGVPTHDDRKLFEFLVLEGMQAGLSWLTVLRKREHFRKAFAGFDPEKVARFDARKMQALLRDEGIIRNRMKIEAAVWNAQALLSAREEFGSFDAFIWRFVGGVTIHHSWRTPQQLPAETVESAAMSRELRKRGFAFVGPTICYAFMQAVGMVNDHTIDCFRWRELAERTDP
ncbi:MAG TPA: DNA-3-methyladenine glycosylase I [Thermodesulfovibrionales bacterium]|nr:DNA-3-methyladenine glycosylase I [Thermodesulfovibrionales bacterium]